MKKYCLVIAFILVTLFISGCENKEKNYLNEISYNEFKDKIKNKDNFFIEIIQTGCPSCQSFTPKLLEVLEEYEITAYRLNITNMNEDDYNDFYDNYGVNSTPEVIFFKDGTEESKLQRMYGDIAKSKIISKLKANGYIEN